MAEPTVDLDYSVHDFEGDTRADSKFLYHRIHTIMTTEGLEVAGRTLDVACGAGNLAAFVHERGGEAWGMDSSSEMLGIGRWLHSDDKVVFVRGIAETLPFRPGTFDRVICQGSLDHFADPRAFMREAAGILSPGGRLVVALSNYESLSCQLGRLWQWLSRDLPRRPRPPQRPYWEIPPDHFHRGDLAFVRELGGPQLQLERCYGVSLLWLTYGWGSVLQRLPRPVRIALLSTLDKIAYGTPTVADMIVSVWQHKEPGPAYGNNHS